MKDQRNVRKINRLVILQKIIKFEKTIVRNTSIINQ